MAARTPLNVLNWIVEDLRREFPDAMFSPRISCIHSGKQTGWESADLALYSHMHTDLELHVSVKAAGGYTMTASDDALGQYCKSYIEGFFLGLDDADVAIAVYEQEQADQSKL